MVRPAPDLSAGVRDTIRALRVRDGIRAPRVRDDGTPPVRPIRTGRRRPAPDHGGEPRTGDAPFAAPAL
ncbi:hypothetical protein [Streptomyces jumonjinensis]|uniref:Uncharacterized protein n=1 Tax=Streptomyces jumonjinensis TaxID=1945 RepID=A0A646KJX3_STRJU|nr:hypothetical protein [Streptomyces jumonjinensis]MQT02523.1 hypothetical protein [Streptomyces jumonjinensis]